MNKVLLAVLLLNVTLRAVAQYPPVNIPGSEVRKINSAIVGQEYELQILLPGNYGKSTKKYPVVYLMDSQWDFPLVKSIYGQQYYDGFIPELIVVGITWGGIKPNPDSLRVRDYTPTNDGNAVQGGQADKFIQSLKNEIFPFVESNYRAADTGRVLMGCSLGGLFTLYTLLTQPALFSGYVAASPAVGWDNEVLYKFERQFETLKHERPVRVYMTVGDVERSRPVYEKFASTLMGIKSSAVFRSKILENTGHSGTKSETYTRGLQFIYEKPKLALAPAILSRYTGRYEMAPGHLVELKSEDGKLTAYVSPQERYQLFAASETEFYSNSEYLNLVFNPVNGKVDGVTVNRYGASQFVKKVH